MSNRLRLPSAQKIALVLILFYAVVVRLQALGYSEYQGDEILTLNFLPYLQRGEFLRYLLTRDKGPLQYLINLLTFRLSGGFDEEIIRLPYAFAGILFVLAIFAATKKITKSSWAGIFAAALAAANGLFIAFSRITQYQAFVQLLLASTIFAVAAALTRTDLAKAVTTLILAGFAFGSACLFHYDALTFLAFACFLFAKKLWQAANGNYSEVATVKSPVTEPLSNWGSVIHSRVAPILNGVLAFFTPFLILAASFYLPFFLRPSGGRTTSYLQRRVLGSGFMPRTLYTKILMKFYMPPEILLALVLLSCTALYFILRRKGHFHSNGRNQGQTSRATSYLSRLLPYALPAALAFTFWFSTKWIKPRGATLLFYLLTTVTLILLFLKEEVDLLLSSLFSWFLASSCFYLFFNKTPRTHVYIIFIPAFILSGYALLQISRCIQNARGLIGTLLKIGSAALGAYLLLISLLYNQRIFIEKNPEYLWGQKKIFGREIIHIRRNRHSKVEGIFGFPQNRGWKKIRELFQRGCLVGSYRTNEKDRIPEFYLHQSPVHEDGDILILVESPVSWNYKSLEKTPPGYVPLKTYYIGDHAVTRIFGNQESYPNGKMFCVPGADN